ncbi:hypothetical protein EGW08_023781, partial [Elysia chlorotica]
IFDEIMTGVGRLGKLFALEYIDVKPDFICVSKGITSGIIPFSMVLTNNTNYEYFYKDSFSEAFLHSHTHSGNVLGAVVANSVLDIFEKENILENVINLENKLITSFQYLQKKYPFIRNIRCIGAVVAADIELDIHRVGFKIYQQAIRYGALIRPLGNTLYWMPPLNSTTKEIEKLLDITEKAIDNVIN